MRFTAMLIKLKAGNELVVAQLADHIVHIQMALLMVAQSRRLPECTRTSAVVAAKWPLAGVHAMMSLLIRSSKKSLSAFVAALEASLVAMTCQMSAQIP